MYAQGKDLNLEDMVRLRGEKLAFTVDEVRFLTGLGKGTIYALVKAGKLRALRLGGRRLLILRDSLEKYLQEAAL